MYGRGHLGGARWRYYWEGRNGGFYISYIFYYNNFDREGPRGADVYISLNVATECSRNYAKNIHRGFNCSRATVT